LIDDRELEVVQVVGSWEVLQAIEPGRRACSRLARVSHYRAHADASARTRLHLLTLLLWVVLVTGFMQVLGATFEALNMLAPSLLPGIQDNEVMQLHHSQPLVEAWTTFGNLAGLVFGVGSIVGGFRLLRGDARGLRITRVCALCTLIYAAIGAVVSAVFLVPLFVPLLDSADPDQQRFALVFLISLVAAGGFFMMFSATVFITFGRESIRGRFE